MDRHAVARLLVYKQKVSRESKGGARLTVSCWGEALNWITVNCDLINAVGLMINQQVARARWTVSFIHQSHGINCIKVIICHPVTYGSLEKALSTLALDCIACSSASTCTCIDTSEMNTGCTHHSQSLGVMKPGAHCYSTARAAAAALKDNRECNQGAPKVYWLCTLEREERQDEEKEEDNILSVYLTSVRMFNSLVIVSHAEKWIACILPAQWKLAVQVDPFDCEEFISLSTCVNRLTVNCDHTCNLTAFAAAAAVAVAAGVLTWSMTALSPPVSRAVFATHC